MLNLNIEGNASVTCEQTLISLILEENINNPSKNFVILKPNCVLFEDQHILETLKNVLC